MRNTPASGSTRRHRRRPPLAALLLAVALAAIGAAAAAAALPREGARFAQHDHRTAGANWHIDFKVGRDGTRLNQLVLYDQRCRETVLARRVPVAPDGTVSVSRSFEAVNGSGGAWTLNARFVDSRRFEGTFRVSRSNCDPGEIAFAATSDDGHSGHSHQTTGHPFGTYADPRSVPRRFRVRAHRLRRAVHAAARDLFPSYRAAVRQNYRRYRKKWQRPVLFHVRRARFDRDGRLLDPRRPESLVYWWPKRGSPVLVAFMFRSEPGRRVPALGGMMSWHSHSRTTGRRGTSEMTHVWLTRGLASAYANCLPVPWLEIAIPRFRYDNSRSGSGAESQPCARAS